MKIKEHCFSLLTILLLSTSYTFAQTDLRSLLEMAAENYPAIAAKQAQAEAAEASVSLEKNTLLPALDAAYQANYATYNNITGMNYPPTLIPISGPPSSENNYEGVSGSAASLTLKWSPLTFGQRAASIEYNKKIYEKQLAGVEDEMLRVKFTVAFMYLEIAATRELIKAYEKNVERNAFNLKQVASLARAGIRPGVDSLKFKGELSKTNTALYDLQNLLETQKHELAELLVAENLQDIEVNDFLFEHLPALSTAAPDPGQNPLLRMAQFDVEANEASLKKTKRSWTPRLEFWGTAYGRGSGIGFDGTVDKADGWSFSRYNYGIGFQLVFPLLDWPNLQHKTRQQEALLRTSESQLRQTQISLNKQEQVARGDLSTNLKKAGEVPVEYEASRSAYRVLQTRYKAGLVDYTELIQAQYDLLNAEARLKNAYIDSWKSLLRLAVIDGDIALFLDQIQQ